jgi:hypothetical protein
MSVYLGYLSDKSAGIPRPIREKNKGDGEKGIPNTIRVTHDEKNALG